MTMDSREENQISYEGGNLRRKFPLMNLHIQKGEMPGSQRPSGRQGEELKYT